MTQSMHCIIAIALFNITFHLILKKTPFMKNKIKNDAFEFLKKYF